MIFGTGATLALATTGATALTQRLRKIGSSEQTLGKEQSSALATTDFHEYDPHDLAEPGSITGEAEFDPTKDLPALGTPETATLTLAGGGTYAGTGFLTKVEIPENAINSPCIASFQFDYDGKTGPAFTKKA